MPALKSPKGRNVRVKEMVSNGCRNDLCTELELFMLFGNEQNKLDLTHINEYVLSTIKSKLEESAFRIKMMRVKDNAIKQAFKE